MYLADFFLFYQNCIYFDLQTQSLSFSSSSSSDFPPQSINNHIWHLFQDEQSLIVLRTGLIEIKH